MKNAMIFWCTGLSGVGKTAIIDGRIWPFLGGKARGKVISESLHLDKYAVVIKDNTSCYHLSYPFNASTRTIDLKKRSPIIFYKREKFFDVEEDVGMSEKDMLKIYDETERMHLSSRKYY